MELQPITPFEPILAQQLPEGSQWIAQIKWDGVRMLSYYDGKSNMLVNRRGNHRTAQYPELADVTAYCKAKSVILDGEIIALHDGKPSFHEVMRRDSLKNSSSITVIRHQIPVIYMIFDILLYNGQSTMVLPLHERQQLLSDILQPHPHVQAVPSYTNPAELFAAAQSQSLEGIVCKDINSTYTPGGKDKRWQKRKVISDLTAVACGVTFRDGIVNALLLGLYDNEGKLHYIGHAGPGKLTVQDKRELTSQVLSLAIDSMPFCAAPLRRSNAVWIKPTLVFKVHYLEWNTSGTLRQPVIQAKVDLPASSCLFPG